MSTDLSSPDDADLGSSLSTLGGLSLRKMFLLYGVLCAVVVGAYFIWIRPAMNRTADAVAETRSAQEELRGKLESSEQRAVSLAAAVEAVQAQTATRYEDANRVINDVRNEVKNLEGVVVRTNTLVSQGSSDLGARIASKVFQRADLIPLRNRAEAFSEELDSLREDFSDWTKMRDELLGGDRGKAVAADEDLVGRFANIELPTVTDLDVQTWIDVLPTLIKPMQDALERDEPSLIPLEEYTKRIEDLAQRIRDASTDIRKAQVAIAAIEQKVQPTRVTDDTLTLRKALEAHDIRGAEKLHAKRTEEVQKRRDELAKMLADEDMKDQSQAVAQEIERKASERAARLAKHELDLKNEEDKRKRAELEARFEAALPDIRSYLRPYTTHGFNQPDMRSMVPTTKKGPVSLSALRGTGALNTGTSNEYNQALSTLRMVTTINNDRPTTGFPFNTRPEDIPYLRKVHNLLIEFGPLMVEKQMLAE